MCSCRGGWPFRGWRPSCMPGARLTVWRLSPLGPSGEPQSPARAALGQHLAAWLLSQLGPWAPAGPRVKCGTQRGGLAPRPAPRPALQSPAHPDSRQTRGAWQGPCWPRAPPDLAPSPPRPPSAGQKLRSSPSDELPDKATSCAILVLGNRENRLIESDSNTPDCLFPRIIIR